MAASTAFLVTVLATSIYAASIENPSPLPDLDGFELQLNQSMSSAIQNIESYHNFVISLANSALDDHKKNVNEQILKFKKSIGGQRANNAIVDKCLPDEGKLESLGNTINDQIKQCATIVLSEIVNVITDSVNEVQAFMSIPTKLAADVSRCGLSNECLWAITKDALGEAVQVPPKMYSLAAKIQSITLRTVVSIDSCGMDGLKVVADAGAKILEDIFNCIGNEIDNSQTNSI